MSDEIRFDGKVAIVTGAGGGIGRAHALLLASRGAAVVVNDLGTAADGTGEQTSAADKVVEEIKAAGGEAVANYNSVSTWDDAHKVVQTAIDNYKKVDILINNAGILRDRSIAKMTEAEYRAVIEVHLNGSWFMTRAAWSHMRDAGYGRILFTTSAAGLFGNFGQSNYSAAKLGLVGLMNTVKLEGMKYNIKSNTIAPVAASRMLGTVMTPDAVKDLDPNHVATMASFLVSDDCNHNGGVFAVGGGHFARAAVVQNSGINIADADISIEAVRDQFDKICDMSDAREHGSAMENIAAMRSSQTS